MKGFEDMKKFWSILDPLNKNEVYVLLLIGKKGGKRYIQDTVLVKSNDFDEFFNKTNVLLTKAKRLPFETELLIDINKKDVVDGLFSAWLDIKRKMNNDEDVRNFFSIILKNIRYSQVTDYVLYKDGEPLIELNPEYIVKAGKVYYHILKYCDDDCIRKPEIPIPGTFMYGDVVQLYYVNTERERYKRS